MRGLLLLVVAVVGCGQTESGRGTGGEIGNTGAASTSRPESSPSSQHTYAAPFWSAYGDNAAAMDAKHKGKRVVVGGRVNSVKPVEGRYALGLEVVMLVGMSREELADLPPRERQWFNEGSVPPGVVAYFPAGRQDQLAKLKKGEIVHVSGRCEGRRDDPESYKGYVVTLDDCEVVPTPKQDDSPNPPPEKGNRRKK
jgi:hypothetical protein